MHDFEGAIRALHAAAKAVVANSPGAAGALSLAIHQHRSTIAEHDKLHQSFERVRDQLVRECLEWLEAASAEGPRFEPTLKAEALSAAREIQALTGKFGEFIKGLDG